MPSNTCFEIRLENNYNTTDQYHHHPSAKLTPEHEAGEAWGLRAWDATVWGKESNSTTVSGSSWCNFSQCLQLLESGFVSLVGSLLGWGV